MVNITCHVLCKKEGKIRISIRVCLFVTRTGRIKKAVSGFWWAGGNARWTGGRQGWRQDLRCNSPCIFLNTIPTFESCSALPIQKCKTKINIFQIPNSHLILIFALSLLVFSFYPPFVEEGAIFKKMW